MPRGQKATKSQVGRAIGGGDGEDRAPYGRQLSEGVRGRRRRGNAALDDTDRNAGIDDQYFDLPEDDFIIKYWRRILGVLLLMLIVIIF